MKTNLEELREYLDYQESCEQQQQSEQDKAEVQGSLLAVGILFSIYCLLLIFGG